MSAPNINLSESDPTLARLENQIEWYENKSNYNQRMFQQIKIIEIAAAACIPLFALLGFPGASFVAGAMGVIVAVLEALLHLNQYQPQATTSRCTCEALKHEKFLYLASAGPYANVANAHALLAESVESLVAREHAGWVTVRQQAPVMQETWHRQAS
jgi:hypothetical protein